MMRPLAPAWQVRSDRKSMEYTLYDSGVAPGGKDKGEVRASCERTRARPRPLAAR